MGFGVRDTAQGIWNPTNYSQLLITWTLANWNLAITRTKDFLHTLTVILLSVTWTSCWLGSNFCSLQIISTNLPLITQTMLQAPDKTCRLSLSALFSVPFKYSVQHCVYIRLHVTCIHSPPHFRLFASTPHNSNLIVVFPWSFELSGVDCNWDPRSTERESRIHSVESRIQDCLGFPYVRQSAFKVKWPGTTQDEWPNTKTHTPKHRKYERKTFPRKWALFSTVV